MEFKGLTSASHMSLPEAGYGSEEGHVGSEISGAVSGVTTPGASRLLASQLQERSATMQRLQCVPSWEYVMPKALPISKEGPYQDRPLLYPCHHNPSLLGSCSSAGSAFSHNKIEKSSFTQTLIPWDTQLPSTIQSNPHCGLPFNTPVVSRCTRRHGGGHVQRSAAKRKALKLAYEHISSKVGERWKPTQSQP